jgi:ABC-type uncharacterized transport system permease subunit
VKRKTLLSILAVVGALLVFLKEQFGLGIDAAGFATALGVVLLYVFFEAKRDIAAIAQQSAKWRDPKFWLAFIAAIVTAVNSAFGLSLPVDIINVVLGFIVSLLFKAKVATT